MPRVSLFSQPRDNSQSHGFFGEISFWNEMLMLFLFQLGSRMKTRVRNMMFYDADLFGFQRILQKIHDDFVAFC